MKWKKDWLFLLIIKEAEKIWHEISTVKTEFGPSPDYLLVSRFADVVITSEKERCAVFRHASLKGAPIQQWKLSDSGLEVWEDLETNRGFTHPRRGMFFQVGSFYFAITPDRKMVVITWQVGPRYGRHNVYNVRYQGQKGQLEPNPDFVHWIS